MSVTAATFPPEMALIETIALLNLPVAASQKLQPGSLCALDGSGNVTAGATATGLSGLGRVEALADNSSGSAGAISVDVRIGIFGWVNDPLDPVTDADRNQTVYMTDNNTICATSATGTKSPAGVLISVDSTTGLAYVASGFQLLIPDTAQSGLSSTNPAAVNDSATVATVGVATTAARGDHAHAHGNLTTATLHAVATASANGFMPATDKARGLDGSVRVHARGVVITNVSSLSAFTGVSGGSPINGITYVAGDIVLLAAQSTATQNGLYVVGTVAAGSAPLTRILSLPTGATYQTGMIVEVGNEGTLFAGSTWKAMCAGGKVVDTDDPTFYPQKVQASVTLSSGTYALGSTEGLYLYSTSTSMVMATRRTQGGTVTSTVVYDAPSASSGRVAGKSGTAVVTIDARVAAGTTNASDNSVIDVLVTNW